MSDILDRAEDLAERYNSSGFIHKEATLLLPELIAEIKRLQAMNPFQAEVPIGIRIAENHFAYSDGEGSAILQRMLQEKDKQAAYVARLEAAYLQETRRRMSLEERYTEPSDWEEAASEALERIKRGEQE